MDDYKIACFDVYYYGDKAKASSIVFQVNPNERIISGYDEIIEQTKEYISGEFYKRELPCILKVYEKIEEDIGLIIVDSFVMLDNGRKGLGGYLYYSLNESIPVIGVAKTFYKGCENYIEVFRGKSKRPLFVSSIGISLNEAGRLVKNLKGENRIPDILKEVDHQSRSGFFAKIK